MSDHILICCKSSSCNPNEMKVQPAGKCMTLAANSQTLNFIKETAGKCLSHAKAISKNALILSIFDENCAATWNECGAKTMYFRR